MTSLIFDAQAALPLVKHSLASSTHIKTHLGETGPGLFLIGDKGVYLTSTGKDPSPITDPLLRNRQVYAQDCNPILNSESWNLKKEQTFGPANGMEYLPISHEDAQFLEISTAIIIEFNADELSVKFIKTNTVH